MLHDWICRLFRMSVNMDILCDENCNYKDKPFCSKIKLMLVINPEIRTTCTKKKKKKNSKN